MNKKRVILSITVRLIIIVYLLFCIKNILVYDDVNNIIKKMEGDNIMVNSESFEEIAEILEKIGIEKISEERINNLNEQYGDDFPFEKTPVLLADIGEGNYNFETEEWTPTSKQIFSFDMECYDVENMYKLALEGISSISNGEVTFTNIIDEMKEEEDKDYTGMRKVTFDMNGKTYTFEAEDNRDWYDLEFFNYINSILKEEKNTKQLYFMSDGFQVQIVFYCDMSWAKLFEENTGCTLADDINQL